MESAELLACLRLLATAETGPGLAIYSDSELLVRQIQGRYQARHPALRPLFAEANTRLARCPRTEIRHVSRAENAEADALANRGIDEAARGRRPDRFDVPGEARP